MKSNGMHEGDIIKSPDGNQTMMILHAGNLGYASLTYWHSQHHFVLIWVWPCVHICVYTFKNVYYSIPGWLSNRLHTCSSYQRACLWSVSVESASSIHTRLTLDVPERALSTSFAKSVCTSTAGGTLCADWSWVWRWMRMARRLGRWPSIGGTIYSIETCPYLIYCTQTFGESSMMYGEMVLACWAAIEQAVITSLLNRRSITDMACREH